MSLISALAGSKQRRERLAYWRSLGFRELWPLLAAVFLLFSILGFAIDLFQLGRTPIPIVLSWSVFTGTVAVAYIVVLSRRPQAIPILIGAQVAATFALSYLEDWLRRRSFFSPLESSTGIHFAAAGALTVVMASYAFFLTFIQSSGARAIRVQAELAVTHGIQQRLVPVIESARERYEVFAQSRPSEKVGGDLAGVVDREGFTYAYLADVSGHGMQSGLLMNMLTTAIRTALLDAPDLRCLLRRINSVLPEVKEPQMYTTFAGLRFRASDAVEVALCGHPPILQFRRDTGCVTELAHSEFPIGLLPAVDFATLNVASAPGDIFALLTDGILETCDRTGQDFGLARVGSLLVKSGDKSLRVLAEEIFAEVDTFGPQQDDQTLLLLRMR